MQKPELVEKVAAATKQPKTVVDAVIGAALDAIVGALKKGDKVQFVGFGTFEVRNRPARMGTNPRTREKVKIAATKAPAFKAGAVLKQAVGRKKK
jgi:DNA-binding protein HU-beta